MSKPMNILESNKNLNGYSKDVLEKLMSLQKESQQQVSRAKSLESEIIARMRERNATRAREELEAQLKVEREEAERALADSLARVELEQAMQSAGSPLQENLQQTLERAVEQSNAAMSDDDFFN